MNAALKGMTMLGLAMCMAAPVMAQEGNGPEDGKERRRERQGQAGDMMQRMGEDKNREPRPGEAQLHEFKKKQQELMRAHFETQMKENREFMEGLKGTDPKEAIAKIREHRTTQHEENVAFFAAQKDEALATIPQILRDAGAPAEAIEKIIEKTTKRFADMAKRMEEHNAEFLKALDDLAAKENVTWDDILRVIEESMRDRRPPPPPDGKPGRGDRPRGEGKGPQEEGGDKPQDILL